MMETWQIVLMALAFPLFMVGMFVLVARITSWMGWSKFARHFLWDRPEPGNAERFGWQTMVIGSFPRAASYRNAMTVWLDDAGIYLRPSLFFRMFHPMLHIGWKDIAAVEPRKVLALQSYKVSFARDLPPLTMAGRSGEGVLERWSRRSDRQASPSGRP